jgi:hypothetical protein
MTLEGDHMSASTDRTDDDFRRAMQEYEARKGRPFPTYAEALQEIEAMRDAEAVSLGDVGPEAARDEAEAGRQVQTWASVLNSPEFLAFRGSK